MKTQLIIRLDPDTKARLSRLARTEGKSNSQLIRELIENYLQERDMAGYIDDLWNRVEGKLTERGVNHTDIETAIRDVRGYGK